VVNLDRLLEHIKGLAITEVTLDNYKKLGLASSKKALIKILGSGELTSALTIHAHSFPSPPSKDRKGRRQGCSFGRRCSSKS